MGKKKFSTPTIVIIYSSLRDTTTQVAKKCFKDEWEEKRVEFIPVEWRTWLSLDKGTDYNSVMYSSSAYTY